jgi:uncharacterized protein (TIGR02246 family)
VRQLNQKGTTMTTRNATAPGTSQDSAIRAVFVQTSRAWADGDTEAFAAWYAPDATVILPGVYLPGQDAIREAMAAAFAGPLKNSRRIHRVQAVRFTDPGTAIVITDSITALPGAPEPPVQQHERATWVLSRHHGQWLVEAYHSCPKHAGVQ